MRLQEYVCLQPHCVSVSCAKLDAKLNASADNADKIYRRTHI